MYNGNVKYNVNVDDNVVIDVKYMYVFQKSENLYMHAGQMGGQRVMVR